MSYNVSNANGRLLIGIIAGVILVYLCEFIESHYIHMPTIGYSLFILVPIGGIVSAAIAKDSRRKSIYVGALTGLVFTLSSHILIYFKGNFGLYLSSSGTFNSVSVLMLASAVVIYVVLGALGGWIAHLFLRKRSRK